MSRNKELKAITDLLREHGGKVSRHDQSGKEQKIEVALPDDPRTYRYHFANGRKDPVRVFRRDFLKAINLERAKRKKPRL
jgi:hypothetical protein